MRKKALTTWVLAVCATLSLHAQSFNQIDENGNVTQNDGNRNFNPNRRDSLKNRNKEVPKGVWAWTVDRRFGEVSPAELDTMPHLYQNSIYATGRYGEFNTIGNNFTARLSRIYIDRPQSSKFPFVDAYSFMRKEPEDFLFLNTLSPYTNISYDNCGDKQFGEDHIDAKFGVNANKRLGMGFDLDYYYARGYYQNQNNAHFRASLYGTYRGDRYQMHALATFYQHKANENGGITNDDYITHPELETTQYSENEIPTVLSSNWNRNLSQHLFFSHRYNVGFYRKVKMTEEEIKARQFASASAKQKANKKDAEDGETSKDGNRGRKGAPVADDGPQGRPTNAKIAGDEPAAQSQQPLPTDSTRIQVTSNEAMDSLMEAKHVQDSIDATMKREYVPVTSFIHTLDINNYDHIYQANATPTDYYAYTYYNEDAEGITSGSGIYDQHQYTSVKNTVALALLEGFNKYMKAGLKAFASYEYRRYKMPDLHEGESRYYLGTYSGHCLNVGGELSKTQGKTFHFNLGAEIGLTGMDQGSVDVNFSTDLNFRLLGDTVRLAAKANFYRMTPTFFQDDFHSKHIWWENSLDAETRTHVEGLFSFDKTNTLLRVAIDEVQNYTYLGMSYTYSPTDRKALSANMYQESSNINVLTLQLRQDFKLGPLNWENVVTYQNSSMPSVLPLPTINLFTNLYLSFKIARVLSVELGSCMTYFSKYNAPDYLPQMSQFAIQKDADAQVELGGYPFVDVYANMHLKRARFFVAMSHVNAGSGSKRYFLTPHYPTNTRILRLGVSWNFYN
ncbi:MAG: putative porin [Prevotella sp.]|nr:putative porin [Prevotella sp.]